MSHAQRQALDAKLRSAPDFPSATIEQLRAGYAAFMNTMHLPAGFHTNETSLAGLRTLVVEPDAGARPGTILFFHGGSWAIGSPETELCLAAQLVVRTGYRALSVDYRLAPEHPFPAGVEDCFAAYRELVEGGDEAVAGGRVVGEVAERVALAGDSAGGGLTITTLIQAQAAGVAMPAAAVTFSAGLDATRSGASMVTRAEADPMFTPETFATSNERYLCGADPAQPLLSPAVLADPTGFPPLLLQVGGNEMLLDDSTRFFALALAAGVDATLDVTAAVPHVFQIFAGGELDEADQALDRAALFLRQHLG